MIVADPHSEARRWLRYAFEDLQEAESGLKRDDSIPRHVCWLAQQAAEKSLKAVFVYIQTDFPETHDLDALRNILPLGWSVREKCPDLVKLTVWSGETPDTGDWSEASADDATSAVRQAKAVCSAVRADFLRWGVEP